MAERPSWPLLPGTTGDALFSGDDHRLWLSRAWGDDAAYALHIGMNPSYAGASNDDLTVRKDQEFTRRMGLSRMVKCNVGTLISTDPAGLLVRGVMVAHPDNSETILRFAAAASRIVVATGTPPIPLRGPARDLFYKLRSYRVECFGLTGDHWPKHSSRLGYDTELREFVW
jgi:hypothetical protein